MQIPEDKCVLETYYTFSKPDLEFIDKQMKVEIRLVLAVQLAVLRYPGWPYTSYHKHPDSVIYYISKQIGALHLRLVFILKEKIHFGII
jgi:TnpA family transposase